MVRLIKNKKKVILDLSFTQLLFKSNINSFSFYHTLFLLNFTTHICFFRSQNSFHCLHRPILTSLLTLLLPVSVSATESHAEAPFFLRVGAAYRCHWPPPNPRRARSPTTGAAAANRLTLIGEVFLQQKSSRAAHRRPPLTRNPELRRVPGVILNLRPKIPLLAPLRFSHFSPLHLFFRFGLNYEIVGVWLNVVTSC